MANNQESQNFIEWPKPSVFDDHEYLQSLEGVALTYSERPAGDGMVITPLRDPPREIDPENTKGTQAE